MTLGTKGPPTRAAGEARVSLGWWPGSGPTMEGSAERGDRGPDVQVGWEGADHGTPWKIQEWGQTGRWRPRLET